MDTVPWLQLALISGTSLAITIAVFVGLIVRDRRRSAAKSDAQDD